MRKQNRENRSIKFPRQVNPIRPYMIEGSSIQTTKCGELTITGSNSFSGVSGAATATDYTYVFGNVLSIVFPDLRKTSVAYWPFISSAVFSLDDRKSYNYLSAFFQLAMCFYVDGQVINWNGSDPYAIYRNIGTDSIYAAGSGGSPASANLTYYMVPGYTPTDIPQQSWEMEADLPLYANGVSLYGKILKCTGIITAQFTNFTWSE